MTERVAKRRRRHGRRVRVSSSEAHPPARRLSEAKRPPRREGRAAQFLKLTDPDVSLAASTVLFIKLSKKNYSALPLRFRPPSDGKDANQGAKSISFSPASLNNNLQALVVLY